MDKMELSVCAHLGRDEEDFDTEVDVHFTASDSKTVVVQVKQGYPSITFFMNLLQFNLLRAALNKFDVKG